MKKPILLNRQTITTFCANRKKNVACLSAIMTMGDLMFAEGSVIVEILSLAKVRMIYADCFLEKVRHLYCIREYETGLLK